MFPGIALACALATPILHAMTLLASDQAGVHDPISVLSQGPWGLLHSVSLLLFGSAQLCLGVGMAGRDRGRFWPYGRALLFVSGALVFYVAYYFAYSPLDTLQSPGANDPLWVVATLVGFAMGLLQPGLARLGRGLGVFNLVCATLWILLVPAILLIGVISLGVYERVVGAVYVVWVAGLGYGLRTAQRQGAPEI